MNLASLVQFQIFTQIITPETGCVAVSCRGITYKAKEVTRHRLTGRVDLLMLGRHPLPLPLPGSFDCEADCAGKAKAACEERCRRRAAIESPPMTQAVLCRIECESEKPPPYCVPECQKAREAKEKEDQTLWRSIPAKPGRHLELSGYDSITNNASCSCPLLIKGCVNE